MTHFITRVVVNKIITIICILTNELIGENCIGSEREMEGGEGRGEGE